MKKDRAISGSGSRAGMQASWNCREKSFSCRTASFLGLPRLFANAEHQSADAAEAIDADFDCHNKTLLFRFFLELCTQGTSRCDI